MKVRQPTRSVNLPSQSAVERRLLHHLNARSRPVEPRHLYGPIADDFNLTAEQRNASRANGDPDWHYLVRQARRRLVDEGLIDDSHKGFWSLSAKGRSNAEWIVQGKPIPDLWDDVEAG
jgi:hypothetical protein